MPIEMSMNVRRYRGVSRTVVKESVIEGSSGVEMIHGVRKKEMYREQKVLEA